MTEFSDFDRRAMARALELAALGSATTQPNPRVGCVLARGERIIAEDWHRRAGEPHAEALALRSAAAQARGATAYVTLEPCSHTGRTPPCADALIAAGVARVVFAVADPDPRVNGGGAGRLQAAGIRVDSGLLAPQAEALNRGFLSRLRRGRPWLRLKLAASLDGRTALANGVSQWITSEAARDDVQQWRAQSAAILTGSGTVLADDPALSVRVGAEPRRQPLRVVLDSRLRTPPVARLLRQSGQTLLFHGADAVPAPGLAQAEAALEAIAQAGSAGLDLHAVMQRLAVLQINEIWAECGPRLAGSLLREGLVDELILYLAPRLLGADARPLAALHGLQVLPEHPEFEVTDLRQIGPDVRIMLRPRSR